MRLHVEYIQRNRLHVPVVQYDRRSAVLLCSNSNPAIFRLVSFVWRQVENHPGFYEFTHLTPVHNGISEKQIFRSSRPTSLYWDQYEQKVLDVMLEMRQDFDAVPQSELAFAVWKIFLFVCDSSLVSGMAGTDFLSLVSESISPLLSNEYRASRQQMAELVLLSRMPELYRVWKYQIFPLIDEHSLWLERLVNG